jgi:hypothetical protein
VLRDDAISRGVGTVMPYDHLLPVPCFTKAAPHHVTPGIV